MTAYYNENDEIAAAWLKELIKEGLICAGHVDQRSIEEIEPSDLEGYDQCHFFAGIGVWSYALRNAGWSDDIRVWTGSCPCQSFSASGKREGFDDKRHLWPAWFRLIEKCRPDVIFGEQVASKDGLAWFDVVSADLERAGYAVGAADLCAAGLGAPHIRQRLYIVADATSGQFSQSFGRQNQRIGIGQDGEVGLLAESNSTEREARIIESLSESRRDPNVLHQSSAVGSVAESDGRDASAEGLQRSGEHGQQPEDGGAGGMADTDGRRCEQYHAGQRAIQKFNQDGENGGLADNAEGESVNRESRSGEVSGRTTEQERRQLRGAGFTNGYWRDAEWIYCRDEKYRPVEPGSFPLVTGAPARVGRLRGYGNSIVAPAAQAFIEAWLETMQ
jgi:DNA (cytosine-5)-methyltransferase 1